MTSLQKYVPNPILDPREGVVLYDDFLSGLNGTGQIGSMGWQYAGTGETVTNPNPNTAGTFGEVKLNIAATSGDSCDIYLTYVNVIPGFATNPNFSTLVFDTRFRCALQQTTNLAFFVGLTRAG